MVSVIPKKVKDDENDALTTPLSLVGTAEELDRDLPTQIRDFVEAHATTVSNLDQIKQELAAAEKAAEEARKEKMKAKKVPPAEKTPPPAKQEPQATLGLFEAPDASVPRDPPPPTAESPVLHPAVQTVDYPD
jgi:PRTRC genetic system protein E